MLSVMNHYQSTHRDRSKPRRFSLGRQSGQEARIAVLEMGVFETRDRLSKIEARIDTRGSKVDTFERKVDALGSKVDTLERKVDALEQRVDGLEYKVDVLASKVDALGARMDTFVTKEELHRELHGLTWRIMGGATLLVSAVYYIARYVH